MYAAIGSWPERSTKIAPIASAKTTEATGTAGPLAHCAVGWRTDGAVAGPVGVACGSLANELPVT